MNKKSNIRIIDIAKMANVSVGTVDRVLHNRGRVSAEKREKVEKILKSINYEPNMVARFLASKKRFVFAVVIPSYSKGTYWDLVCQGISKSVNELRDFNVSVNYIYFDQYNDKSFQKVVSELSSTEYAGVLIATLFKDLVIRLSQHLNEANIPYIYIDSNIPDQNNLSYFGADSRKSGAIAARFMISEIGLQGNIIIAHAKNDFEGQLTQLENREYGFLNHLKECRFEGNIFHLNYRQEDKTQGIKDLDALLPQIKENTGGIIFNSRIFDLANLISLSKTKDITLIGFDTLEKNIEALKQNKVSILIAQRSLQQGQDGIKALSNHLIFNTPLEKENLMPIDILIKENIDFYNNYKF